MQPRGRARRTLTPSRLAGTTEAVLEVFVPTRDFSEVSLRRDIGVNKTRTLRLPAKWGHHLGRPHAQPYA